MSFIQNLFTSRDNNANAETYVGQQDRLWYSPNTNAIYVNSANVAGGTPVTLPATANLVINTITANSGNITGNLIVSGNISPASNVKIGGVRAGPGANISNDGLLTIDTAGLPFSFGDFTANANLLTLVNVDQNMVLATQGNAEVQLVGNIGFYKVDGFPPNISNRYASFSDVGIVEIKVTATGNTGAVNIIGSSSGTEIPPGLPGTMLHITGQLDTPCRLYYDGNSDYVSMVARRFNGNVDVPTQVLANEDVLRINSTAATNAGVGNVGMAQIRTTALENQTTTAQGSSITFTVTPIGSPANARVDVANVTVANGITATKFTTAGTVIATGNITGGNILTAGLISSTGNITGGNILGGANVNATLFTGTTVSVTGNITGGNVLGGANVNATTHTGATVSVTGNVTGGNVLTAGLISSTGNITGGNVAAMNYTGLVTHSIRNAGVVSGTTLTLNVTTDDIVKCTFADNFTIAFSNIIAGRVVTLIATNTSAGDTDIITAGISSVNMQGDSTLTVTQQTTAVITYYSLDGDTANIYASAVYA
jgi:hypothetical protein